MMKRWTALLAIAIVTALAGGGVLAFTNQFSDTVQLLDNVELEWGTDGDFGQAFDTTDVRLEMRDAAGNLMRSITDMGTTGNLRATGDLLVDGGDIGLTGDADLLGLAANALTVRGSMTATGAVSGTTGTLSGDLLVNGGDIGLTGDTDLLGLAANALTVRGTLTATGAVYLGTLDTTRALLYAYGDSNVAGGLIDIQNGAAVDDVTNNYFIYSDASGNFKIRASGGTGATEDAIGVSSGTTHAITLYKAVSASSTLAVTGAVTLTDDLAVNGGDLTSTAASFNLLATPTTLTIGAAATALSMGSNAGGSTFTFNTGAITQPGGPGPSLPGMTIGTVDTYPGYLTLHSAGTTTGGVLSLYTPGDADTDQNYWMVKANSAGQFEISGDTGGASILIDDTGDGISLTGASTWLTQGALTVGSSATTRGSIILQHGSGSNTPGYIQMKALNGTSYYLFVETDGTLKLHTSAPAADTDGNVVGAQT